ncbi:hypothetical protein [Microseira sp. BLCC-F43]|uniref:hypothetical protein n=1 Tax=Microseira sp. BLCC-F43 TaxID=3153602 RepID=UPI0035BC6325
MKIAISTYGGRDAHPTKPSSCGVGVPPAIVVSLFIFTYLFNGLCYRNAYC